MTSRARQGGCRCGQVRFRLTQPALLESICHCTGCQRMTGSAFSTTITVPSNGFELIAGDPVIGGIHGPQARHFHCDDCKSWVFTRVEPDMGFVNVRATMLDKPNEFRPYVEMQTAERLGWAAPEVPRSFERFPVASDYPALMAAYKSWRPSP